MRNNPSFICVQLLLLGIAFLFLAPSRSCAAIIPDGTYINTDIVWGQGESPYIIEGDLEIAKGGTLSLLQGTHIVFAAHARLIVSGVLDVRGSIAMPVILESSEENNSWGIDVLNGQLSMDHVVMRGGEIFSDDSTIYLNHITASDIGGDFIGAYSKSDVQIDHASISSVRGNMVGVYDDSSVRIDKSSLRYGFRPAVSVYDSKVSLDRVDCSGGSSFAPCLEIYGTSSGNVRFSDFVHQGNAIYNGTDNSAPLPSIIAPSNWWNSSITFDEREGATTIESPLKAPASTTPSVAFFPGIKASQLFSAENKKLWEPYSPDDVKALLPLTSTTPLRDGATIYAKSVIERLPIIGPIYAPFIKELDNAMEQGLIGDWKAMPYDWRLLPSDIVRSETGATIIDALEMLAGAAPSGKVVMIGHSYGGLVLDAFLEAMARDNRFEGEVDDVVQSVLYVAVPHEGAFAAIASLLHGYGESILGDFVLSEVGARTFARLLPSVYRLLPSESTVSRLVRNSISFDEKSFANLVEPHIFSYDKLIDFLLYPEKNSVFISLGNSQAQIESRGATRPIGIVRSVFDYVVEGNRGVGSDELKYLLRFYIAGIGRETLGGLLYGKKMSCSKSSLSIPPPPLSGQGGLIVRSCNPQEVLYYKPVTYRDGDGVVTLLSALNRLKKNATSAQIDGDPGNHMGSEIMIDLSSSKLKGIAHGNMMASEAVHQIIFPLLNSPKVGAGGIVLASPLDIASSTKRWRISAHSPVLISVANSQGNVQGIIATTSTDTIREKDEISGGVSIKTGEDFYIVVPDSESEVYTLTIQGVGIGIASLDIEYVDSIGGEPLEGDTTWSYGPFPVHLTWNGKIILGKEGRPSDLYADVDDDAIFDLALNPNANVSESIFASTTYKMLNTLCVGVKEREDLQGDIMEMSNKVSQGVYLPLVFPRDYPAIYSFATTTPEIAEGGSDILNEQTEGGVTTYSEFTGVDAGYRSYKNLTENDTAKALFSFIKSVWKGAQ